MTTIHKISLIRYLIGASLKHFVYNENNNPIVTCHAIVGQWVLKTETAPGGHPHAEVLCLSELAREKPDEMILSLSPCIEFDKTPPCCYSLLASCSSITILELDKTQPEFVRFLRCFISVGWTKQRSIHLIPSTCFKVNSTIDRYLLNPNVKLLTNDACSDLSLFNIARNAVSLNPNPDIAIKVHLFAKKLQREEQQRKEQDSNALSKPSDNQLNNPLYKSTLKVQQNIDHYRMFIKRLQRFVPGLSLKSKLNFIDPIEINASTFMTVPIPITPIEINHGFKHRTNVYNPYLERQVRPLTRRVFLNNQIINS
ncbi:Riboflavin biosynthesis protein RibD [Candidatus Hodgkinia cicadicola]|uniref:Riboflavin biosynthesis protein RibD n=1 Tax=Candidatus Hodgkinia cicadicola TaxID=573658 RepID=A0ABX4MGG2_9HYPH|nr:Riboflavin biosynthesis protein RibD [Candidatus Hodgkinia cicadicola]